MRYVTYSELFALLMLITDIIGIFVSIIIAIIAKRNNRPRLQKWRLFSTKT